MRKTLGIFVFSFLVSAAAFGQFDSASTPDMAPISGNTFGVADEVAAVVSPFAIVPGNSGNVLSYSLTSGWRIVTALTDGLLMANVSLPAGALVHAVELQACDFDASHEVRAQLWATTNDNVVQIGSGGAGTGVSATPGCASFRHDFSPFPIDTASRSFFVLYRTTTTGETIQIGAARVFYKRQISPAPSAAQFADVPTSHPLFQYIEALAASGITAGCGGGNFCPNDPLTRGQMAVFLAKALGLHWTP